MDEGYHIELAGEILDGDIIGSEPFYRAPLYPYFLAGMLALTGGNPGTVRVIQCALGALLPLLIFLIALRLFDRRVALTAAIAGAVYPTLIYYDASLLITSLMTLLCAGVILQTLRAQDNPTSGNFAALGALIGLTALARPNILFFLPALAIWVWLVILPKLRRSRSAAVKRYALVILCAGVVIMPVTARNWIVTGGDFIPIAWQGGYNFFLGNNRDATGWSATAPGINATWMGGYLDAINLAQNELGRKLSEKEIDDFWWDLGWKEVANYPLNALGLQFKKFAYFWGGYEIPNNQNIYIVERFSIVASALFWQAPLYFPAGLLMPLALMGIFSARRKWRVALPLYLLTFSYMASVMMFFVCARFRQPVLPILLIFGSYGFYSLIETLNDTRRKRLIYTLAALGILGAFSSYASVGIDREAQSARDSLLLGNAYQAAGKLPEAQAEFERAIEIAPEFAEAYNNLGQMSATKNDFGRAARYFREALRIDPDDIIALSNLGMVMLQTDNLNDARELLEKARSIDGLDFGVHYRLGLVYHTQGKYDLARVEYLRALELNPDYGPARKNLAELLE